ncbi:unnamed protein product [Phaeothamnion confervicola]
MQAPTRSMAMGLYRSLRKTAKSMTDYNYREYSLRRSRLGFDQAKELEGADAMAAYVKGLQDLQMLKRQALIGSLYPHEQSVMESTEYENSEPTEQGRH